MSRFVVVVATLFVLLGFLRAARGVDYFWNKSNGGAFGVASNWGLLPGGPGDADDTVNFELDRSTAQRYAVIGVSGENNRLLVHNDALTLVLSDDYSLQSFGINPPSMVVGVANGEVGDVILSGAPLGGVSSVLDTRRVVLGQSAGSTGVVTTSNLRWVSDEEIYVGDSGEGILEIVGQSDVTSRSGVIGRNVNSTGSATVSDSSSWTASHIGAIAVGGAGEGMLMISDGGTVYGGIGTVGSGSTSVGTATVTGAGSNWSCLNEFYVGAGGRGTLTISAGGSVENHRSYIGEATGSVGSVSVTGSGSSWTDNSDLFLGHHGDGTLTVSNGGRVTNDRGFVAFREDSSGDINVAGIGSTWTNREALFIGYEGEGSLAVSAGGMVSSATGSIASFDGSSGSVVVTGSGSTWNNSGALRVGDQGEGTLTISAGATVSNANGYVGFLFDSTGEVTVSGAGSLWTNTSALDIGTDSLGKLRIEAGGAVTNTTGRVGGNPLGIGTVIVAGQGSEWSNSGLLVVGHVGLGALTVEAGATVSNTSGIVGDAAGSKGTVVVRGQGTDWTNIGSLSIGDEGEGAVTIALGGSVVSFMDGTLGVVADSTGAVTVRDKGSSWAVGDFLRVGDNGEGTLSILDGGRVTNGDGRIAAGPGSTGDVVVRGAGSIWTNFDTLNVGSIGTGTLSIETGGHVSNTNASIGSTSASDGTVTVTGARSSWASNGELRIDSSGTGRLTIQSGGSVTSANGILASTGTSIGRVTVTGNGSNWMLSGRLSIAGNAVSGTSGGTAFLNVQPGGQVDVAQDTVIFPNGQLTLEGGVLATTAINFEGGGQFNWTSGTLHVGVYEGDLANPPNGTLAPGRSAGSTTILGDYTQQAGATLAIEIGGTATATQFDFVDVNGTATLGGELELALINGFVPSAANQFVVFNADDLLSFFANVGNGQRLDTVDGLASFLVHYGPTSAFNPNQIVLTNFLSMLPGDYNQSGTVDAADYSLWRDHIGSPTSLPNDNTPGVAEDDYTRWRTNFGRTVSGGSGASVGFVGSIAPEPSGLLLLLAGIGGITFSAFLVPKRRAVAACASDRPAAIEK